MNAQTKALTLWQVFSSVDPHGESSPSQRQPCWPQQVSFYIFFILHTLAFVSLKPKQTHSHSDGNIENSGGISNEGLHHCFSKNQVSL